MRTKKTDLAYWCTEATYIHDCGSFTWRKCERRAGHTGRHGARYCGRWRYWPRGKTKGHTNG